MVIRLMKLFPNLAEKCQYDVLLVIKEVYPITLNVKVKMVELYLVMGKVNWAFVVLREP